MYAAIWSRLCSASFSRTLCTWLLIVCVARWSRCAISLLLIPTAIRSTTSRSRFVNCTGLERLVLAPEHRQTGNLREERDCQGRRENVGALCHRANGVEEIVQRGGFQDEARHAGLHVPHDVFVYGE